MEKGKKIMYEQNGNVTQDIENIKRKKKILLLKLP